ncbi:RDD family protein [Mycetocola zhujimingii]|uniref:RDD family protein n=1 Tax=Mycetocola zhujimingii TaxID=2079792 RepID=A0A2U1TGP8_9MICO|nr:RDD family protein [Mycetocola zhujimingii]AWB86517.1 RDD family protein [Mycetocola zhujimingii]PWC08067.1 RDD family protein [Mycetocola zhujimingii]
MPADSRPNAPSGDIAPSRYPGERLGLPESGQHSVARLGRRLGALTVDWIIAMLVSAMFFNADAWANMLVFAVLQIVFLPTIGASIGHRVFGLRLIRVTGGWAGVWRPIVRTALLVIVVPALVWDSDQRGFHDKVAGTVLIRG